MFTSVDQSFSRLSYGSKPFKSLFFKIPIPGVGIQLINILRLVFFLFSVHDGMQTAHSYAYDAPRSSFLPKMAEPERVDSYTSLSFGTNFPLLFASVLESRSIASLSRTRISVHNRGNSFHNMSLPLVGLSSNRPPAKR